MESRPREISTHNCRDGGPDENQNRNRLPLVTCFLTGFLTAFVLIAGTAWADSPTPEVGDLEYVGLSASLDSIQPPARKKSTDGKEELREVPRFDFFAPQSTSDSRKARRDTPQRKSIDVMRAKAAEKTTEDATHSNVFSFEGLSNEDNANALGYRIAPPDTNGDVGPDHYVQAVNVLFQVFDKETGEPVSPPLPQSALFASVDPECPCATDDDGDPIVLYDPLADRWMVTQFRIGLGQGFRASTEKNPTAKGPKYPPFFECIAVSETGDATGAYHLYVAPMVNEKFNDYPKFGVWPDAYYMMDNQFDPYDGRFIGSGVFAFDRDKMLEGDEDVSYVYFDLEEWDPVLVNPLPADLDGPAPPQGTPNYFAALGRDSSGGSDNSLRLFEFIADFENPETSTFIERPESPIPVDPFGVRNFYVPQPDTDQRLDVISDRLMHRLQYRNFGTHESLVLNHSVDTDGSGHAGVRYYELRRNLPDGTFQVNEQATHAPDSNHRWMGSAAMDKDGNLAVGFSIAGTSLFPSIRYAARMASDPPDGLFQGEVEITPGSGFQEGTNRWGDYSSMSVDPVDDSTFWYTQEYYSAARSGWASWQTRIASFSLTGDRGLLTGVVSDSETGLPVPGATIQAGNRFAYSGETGTYSLSAEPGDYAFSVFQTGYYPHDATASVVMDMTATLDIVLDPIPLGSLSGRVTAATPGGLALENAAVRILNSSGAYSLRTDDTGLYAGLVEAGTYTVSAVKIGFATETVAGAVVVRDATTIQDFTLQEAYGQFHGVIVDWFTRQPIEDAFVIARSRWFAASGATTNASGEFVLDLQEGYYDIGVGADGYETLAAGTVFIPQSAAVYAYIPLEKHPVLSSDSALVSGGNGDGVLDADECVFLDLSVTNSWFEEVTGVQATLSSPTWAIEILQGESAYPDLAPDATGTNLTPFEICTHESMACGEPVDLVLDVTTSQQILSVPIRLTIGGAGIGSRFHSTSSVSIPDDSPEGATSEVVVSGVDGGIASLQVSLHITHTWVGDLELTLIGPDGTEVLLTSAGGKSRVNLGTNCPADGNDTTFDDYADLFLDNARAPYVGTYQPEEPLAAFQGKSGSDLNGVWTLWARDLASYDTGVIECWSLSIASAECSNVLLDSLRPAESGGSLALSPDGCVSLLVDLENAGVVDAASVSAVLWTLEEEVEVTQASSAYPDIPVGATATNLTTFEICASPYLECPAEVELFLDILSSDRMSTVPIQLSVGSTGDEYTFAAVESLPIPDYNPVGVDLPIDVSGVIGSVDKVSVTLHLPHANVRDLRVSLISPDGTEVRLVTVGQSRGAGFGVDCPADGNDTTFDDAATESISSATGPYTGVFVPRRPLDVFRGLSEEQVNGTWRLHAEDVVGGATGSLECCSIAIQTRGCPPPAPTRTPTRDPALPTWTPTEAPVQCDSGYYILDSFGGRHRVGNPISITGPLYFGLDIAQDMERAFCLASAKAANAATADLVVLDGLGAAHFVAHPECGITQDFYYGDTSTFPKGRAVDIEMSADSQGFWVLTDFGGIHRAGSTKEPSDPTIVPNTDKNGVLGFDVPIPESERPVQYASLGGATLRAVSLAVLDPDADSRADGYIVLDSMGGRFHYDPDGTEVVPGSSCSCQVNTPARLIDPAGYVWPFFRGLDIARDMELHTSQQGVVILDGWDGIHPVPVDVEDNPVFFANNVVSMADPTPASTIGMPYITAGFTSPVLEDGKVNAPDAASIFADLEFTYGCNGGLYTLDGYGGVFALGTARTDPEEVVPDFGGNSPYFYPLLYAEDIEFFGADETGYEGGETSFFAID